MTYPYYVKGLIGKVLAMADNISATILREEQEIPANKKMLYCH